MRKGVHVCVVLLLCCIAACGQKAGVPGSDGPAAPAVAMQPTQPPSTQPAPLRATDVPAAAAMTEKAPPTKASAPVSPSAAPTQAADPQPSEGASARAPRPRPTGAAASDEEVRTVAFVPPMCPPFEFPPSGRNPRDGVTADINAYGERHPEDWASSWWWGNRFRIAFTGNLEAHEQRLERVIADREDFELVKAQYSYRELMRVHRMFRDVDDDERFAGSRITAVGDNVVANRITVMLDRVNDRVRRELGKRYPDPKYCVEEGTPTTSPGS